MDKSALLRHVRLSLACLALNLLASCGGGDPESVKALDAAGSRKQAAAFAPTTPIPADANVRGMWSGVNPWPIIPVHAALLPDGRVMSYGTRPGGQQTAFFDYDVWDPSQGLAAGHLTLPNGTATDIFCSSQIVLPDGGSVFIAGGDNWTGSATTNTGNNNSNLFSVGSNSLTRTGNMNRPRWYSSSITLLNGETYIQGGSGGQDRPEVRQENGTFRLLTGANTSNMDFMYPRNFVAPDGRVFGYDSAGKMYYVSTTGTGTFTTAGTFTGSYAGSDASAAMFRPGRILQFGGNSAGAIVIDIRSGTPTVTPTQSMSTQRRLVTGTILPNGQVLATGGSRTWNELDLVNNSAEIWNPDTGTWTVGASGVQARLYHSMALLLPDATVMVGGGGAPGPQNNRNFELYFPPYLFGTNGSLASRPVIDAAPTVMDIGHTYTVDVSGAGPAARVVMVKNGSVTHSWNMGQRFVELTFVANGNRLSVQAPTRAADAPPGFYMLFVLDANGVPSVAKMVRVNVASIPNPAIVPTLGNPGDQTGTAGAAASLALTASDPNGDPLGFGAVGLPPGLSINPLTGAIAGTPTTAGTFNVVVAVSDGVNSATVNFVWTIAGAPPLAVAIPTPPAATQTGGSVTFTAAASNGVNPQFRWDFGDGTAPTAWGSSPTASHTYAQAGLYLVTVTAIDERGVEQRQSVMQPIHLPIVAGAPSASSNIAYETRGGGANPRLWVVNQDNDSVSVFDTVTHARLAEVAVGTAPRTLAIAANGMVWVANKGSATISIIDPATLAISRTLTLPRGSQPFGVATANGIALVVLEAGGQVLKFDTASYAQTGTLSIGAHARHVSLAPGGATAYVSRFITPPQAGESGASPQATGGAELLTVGTAAMNLVRTVTLAHSTREDAENQGRGVPNYLGAAAVSPDGVSAWVPSKLDNIQRGMLRDGLPLNFQNTVRAVSSRVVLATGSEDPAARIDHDNASMASAAVFDPKGLYLFVALETSREIVVVDAHGKRELFRIDTGLAPQGVAVAPDGLTLYVNNFMDRSVGAYDLRPLVQQGLLAAPPLATLGAVGTEKLGATVLLGKKLFYDARDPRLARDRYMSCASCHNDGGHDGRVWDLTGFGEGVRNTVSLRGRSGAMGFLHWSNNFDEVQDFEGQIRNLAGGTGLMADAAFATGTRSEPLGDPKAGLSADLDALAAYLGSLSTFDASPYRPSAAALSSAATEGKALFSTLNCASCHGGSGFSNSGANTLSNIGTIKSASGQRLWGPLTGIDVPTLRDVWGTAPYLHDGSAATLEAAVRAHAGVTINDANLARVTAYLREIGADETSAPPATGGSGAWTPAATPTTASANDTSPVELGVKFRVDVAGYVTGVRFYKGGGNTGTHVGSLWSSSGTRLATATFTDETASGWQQVTFAAPVPVAANTVYVASYFAPNGGYAVDPEFFTASGVSTAPVHLLRDGESGGNGVYVYASASSFPASTFRASNYWVDVVFTTMAPPDATAPTVSSTSPTHGATNVGVGTAVTASFSEPLDAATMTAATFELRNAANVLVPATVSYDAATRVATLTPSAPLAAATGYTATVRGSTAEPRVKDLAGNALATNQTWSFTTAAPMACPCTIWPAGATPAVASANDTGSVNLGVKFRADVAGYVTGIRFYKGSGNTGTHIGALWSSSGTLLAQATFVGETASGWQQVSFATPVAVAANTTYVASYLAPNGRYAIDSGHFATTGVDNGPLHALSNGVGGGNGVFAYGAGLAFPNGSWNASNYWVDVVLSSTPPVDTTPPTLTAVNPTSAATGVPRTAVVTATFSEAMDATSLTTSSFELRGPGGTLVAATVGYNAATRVATLSPAAQLAAATTYTVTLRGGTTEPRVRDIAGNALAATSTWSFTTVAIDTTPPTVTVQSPAAGATGVAMASAVNVTFSEAMDAATIGASTIELRTPANTIVPAGIAYNATTRVATLTPSSPLAASTTFTVTVRGGAGDPRAKDVAGNALAENSTWSFTTAAGPVCPCNIWPATATPGNPSDADTGAVNLGVKFRSDVAGTISGIRFYKGGANTGTHIGALWTSTGTLLAQATFVGETASGWQQVNFATPVAIAANTVYVASYLAPNGRYAGDNSYFNTSGVDNGPLHALQNGVSGGNGVYAYGGSLAFPTSSWNASNYWVDVVFAPSAP